MEGIAFGIRLVRDLQLASTLGLPNASQHDSVSAFLLRKEVDRRSFWQTLFAKNFLDDLETVPPVKQQQIDIGEL